MEDKNIVVETKLGAVSGRLEVTDYGSSFCTFHRIPYAKPPVGPLRFLPPVPLDKWEGVLDGTKSADIVQESNRLKEYYWGSEDCLYLNVRKKALNTDKLLPVMVWIGGIGFTFDSSQKLCSGLLTDEDVVFVHVTFRIGVFGFLSVREATAPGNCGLKDVVMALKWVQQNIEAFGGDSDNVTLFGSGSGGSMVHYMMLSPMATGLFHKAILQSGCALNNWALTRNPVLATLYLAKELGIKSKHPVEVVEILRTLPELEIFMALKNIITTNSKKTGFPLYSLFRPCIESEIEGQEAFITKGVSKLIRTGNFNKVPFIIGCNKTEGYVFKNKSKGSESYDLYNKNLTELVPSELCIKNPNAHSTKNVGLRLMEFYVTGDTVNELTAEQYFQFMSDYHFLYHINKCVKLHSAFSNEYPLYYYVFDHDGSWGFSDEMEIFNLHAHAGEIPYLFQLKDTKFHCTRDSFRTQQKMIKLWTNFAKYGNPTPNEDDELLQVTWDPVVDKTKLNFLSIGSELTKGRNPFYDRMSFWEQLLDETTFMRICRYLDELMNTNPEYLIL